MLGRSQFSLYMAKQGLDPGSSTQQVTALNSRLLAIMGGSLLPHVSQKGPTFLPLQKWKMFELSELFVGWENPAQLYPLHLLQR